MELFIAQILTGLANASSLFLVACGLSLIFGVTRIVNFAHGSLYMIGAYTGYTLMQVLPGAIGFWGAILLSGVAVGIVGVMTKSAISYFGMGSPIMRTTPRRPGARGPRRSSGPQIISARSCMTNITPKVATN